SLVSRRRTWRRWVKRAACGRPFVLRDQTDPASDRMWLQKRLPHIDRARRGHARTSARGVRREKAALSSGCKAHPANAPAGSNRSSQGGDELAEASGKCEPRLGGCASVRAVTRSERRAGLENDDAQADPTMFAAKAYTGGRI